MLANTRNGVFLVALATLGSAWLPAAELESHVATLAKRVAAVCDEEGYKTVVIKFDEPRGTQAEGGVIFPSSGSQMLATLLGEALKKNHDIDVKKFRAEIKLNGEILIDELQDQNGNGQTTALALEITVRFVDRTGKPVVSVRVPEVVVEDSDTIAQILGLPFADDDPRNDSNERDPIVNGIVEPNQSADKDGIVRAFAGSPFAIQLLGDGRVDSQGRLVGHRVLPADDEDGLAFVELKQEQVFSVRLINESPHEVGVKLTLDGIDSFHFTRQRRVWLVPPRSSITVNGWQVDFGTAQRFTVRPFERSLAAKLKLTEAVGVIQASFSRTWKQGEPIPEGEEGVSRSSNGIGVGENITSSIRNVPRNLGRVRASIPLRYERP